MTSTIRQREHAMREIKGARPNTSAATAQIANVKSRTVPSGARPVSICDHAARARVAARAKIHPRAAPIATSKMLSSNSCRKICKRLAPKCKTQTEFALARAFLGHQQHGRHWCRRSRAPGQPES